MSAVFCKDMVDCRKQADSDGVTVHRYVHQVLIVTRSQKRTPIYLVNELSSLITGLAARFCLKPQKLCTSSA